MATRLKTVEYWFPELAAVTDNTDTNFTQITVYLSESGTKTFRSVLLEVIIQDAEATSNNVNRRQVSLQIGSSGYTAVNNTNLFTSGGEQKWIMASGNFTALFTSGWSGTSMTCDARILCDSAIATPAQAWRCATAKLTITYEYDDTSTTQTKTVRLPLATGIGNVSASRASAAAIPNLSTWIPESSVTIRQYTIIVQGNEEYASTTDSTMSWEVDTLGIYTTGSHEHALNTSCWYRHCQIQSFGTSSSRTWYFWGSLAIYAHAQAWMVITYDYDDSASTTILNSLILPMEFDSPGGGTTSSDFQRGERTLWIAEPTTLTIQESALFLFWDQLGAVTGIQYRVSEGAWSGALTSTAATVAGSCGAMYRCETYLPTLVRGKNSFNADIYRTDTADLLYNICSFFMLNYTSGKMSSGTGAHNKSIQWNIADTGTAANAVERIISATALNIPETEYYLNAIGSEFVHCSSGSVGTYGVTVQAERLSGEGGLKWIPLYLDIGQSDNLPGVRQSWSMSKDVFKRWANDWDSTRLDVETSRRYRLAVGPAGCWSTANLWVTYHSKQYTISGTVSGSNGGTVTLLLIRETDRVILKSTTRSGNGTYSFTWYDDTTYLYVEAYEDNTHVCRSARGYAS